MTPVFVDPAVQLRWDAYFADVERFIARAGVDAADLRSALEAHVADSMAAASGGTELERLDIALSRLGRPAEYLRPLLADELIDRGTLSYSPITIARGLMLAALTGSRRTVIALVFGLGYVFLAAFASMAVLWPVWRGHVGVFRNADGSIAAGIVSHSASAQELLGWWSMPIALLLAALLYFALTKGLRAARHRRKPFA